MYSYTKIEFFGKSPMNLVFFRGLDGSDLSVLWTLRLKVCFVENAEDMSGVVSEVDVAVLTCNCSDIFFLKRYSLVWSAFFFLNSSYIFGSRYFCLSLSVIFVSHRYPCTYYPLFGRKLYSNLSLVFCLRFSITSYWCVNLLTNY